MQKINKQTSLRTHTQAITKGNPRVDQQKQNELVNRLGQSLVANSSKHVNGLKSYFYLKLIYYKAHLHVFAVGLSFILF